MLNAQAQWLDDVDGDVLRRLQDDGFDFSAVADIDFSIDFASWPPSAACMATLSGHYPDAELIEPERDDDGNGFVLIILRDRLSYELVMRVQRELTEMAAPYGGKCDSWGAFSN